MSRDVLDTPQGGSVAKVEKLMLQLVQAVEEECGSLPQRIIVEPNGYVDVNGRVGFRDESWPVAFNIERPKEKQSGK
jgi:hypothetical protein